MGFKSHIWKKKKTRSRLNSSGSPGFRVDLQGRPGFGRAVATAGLLLNPDRSSHQADPWGRAGFNNSALDKFKFVLEMTRPFSVGFRQRAILVDNTDESFHPWQNYYYSIRLFILLFQNHESLNPYALRIVKLDRSFLVRSSFVAWFCSQTHPHETPKTANTWHVVLLWY